MNKQVVDLYSYFGLKRQEGAKGYLTAYTIDNYGFCEGRIRPAMLVIAGGGYSHISEREKEIVGFEFLNKGYHIFTLDYSLNPIGHPTQLIEGAMAIAYIRENADKLFIDKDHIGAIGFSAGGHLCGMLATIFDDIEVKEALGERAKLCRPDAVILSYAVLSAFGNIHAGSIDVLSKGDESIKKKIDLPKRVTEKSSPAFIWHTIADGAVPCENSFLMAMAYREKGVPFELHTFEQGGHGLSIAKKESLLINVPAQQWVNLMFTWLEGKGFNIKDKGE